MEQENEHVEVIDNADESHNAVSSLLENFELPDISTVKEKKISFQLDSRVRMIRKLTPHDKGLMGTAHQLFVQNKIDDAIKISMEVIRNCPGCPEPYQLLKAIVEDNGFHTHAHQLGLFIASINPHTDAETWIELAEESKNMGEAGYPIAISCYRNAYQRNKDGNIKLLIGNIFLKLKQWTFALQAFKQALINLPPHRGLDALKQARSIAREIYILSRKSDQETAEKMKFDALELLLGSMRNHSSFVSDEDVNYSADLFIELEQYEQCWKHLQEYCGFGPLCEKSETRFEFTSKAGIALLSLGEEEKANSYLESFISETNEIEEYGDLWFQVCEHYLSLHENWRAATQDDNKANAKYTQYVEKALWIVEKLLRTQNYCRLLVYLRHADCLELLGRYEEAISALEKLAELSDEHRIPARNRVAQIQTMYGKLPEVFHYHTHYHAEDDQFFNDLERSSRVEAKFVFNKMKELMERSEGGTQDTTGMRCAADLGLYIMTHGFGIALVSEQTYLYQAKSIKGFEQHPGRYVLINQNLVDQEKITADLENVALIWYGWYRLYREVLGTLIEVGREMEALLLAEASLKVRIDNKQKDQDHTYRRQMHSVVLAIALSSKNYDRGYMVLKEWIRKDIKSGETLNHQWNLFNYITNKTNDVRHHRFLLRLCLVPGIQNYALCILIGHVTRETRSYRYSADSYARAMRLKPDCPFPRLYLATIYTQIAAQKFTTNRASAATQAIAFLSEYKDRRGDLMLQEVYYNTGRVLHQLGLHTMALNQYKKVLVTDANVPEGEKASTFCLKGEAAYNMSLIYRNSGNYILAKQIISKYCRI